MRNMWLTLSVCALGMIGCVDSGDSNENEGDVISAVTRPPLSSICSFVCNNSHLQHTCFDQRTSGQVNVSVFPLIEGKTVLPATIINNAGSWSNTSCPNCQWNLVSPQPSSFVSTATDDVNVHHNVNGQTDSITQVNIQIVDPTDASVGVCNLSVGVELVTGIVE
jgi:hypothetical protein